MTNLQEPIVNNPLFQVEIDYIISDIQSKLDTNLSWLTHDYSRAYRHLKIIDGKKVYFPEIYLGKKKGVPSYYRPTPDNDKKGMCFFVVGKEKITDFQKNQKNLLSHDLGIVFWVNLELINSSMLETDLFTQNLISEVRSVFSSAFNGVNYRVYLKEICREFSEIYKEFTLEEKENYLLAPYQGFRINALLTYEEECVQLPINQCSILQQNISKEEILTCLLPTLDFTDSLVFNSLTAQQKNDLTVLLCGI